MMRHRRVRRITRLAKVRNDFRALGGVGYDLDHMVEQEVIRLVKEERRRSNRRLRGEMLAVVLCLLLVGGTALATGLLFGRWWTIAIAFIVAFCATLLVVAGLRQLFSYTDRS